LLTKVRTLIHKEISLLTVLYFPFRARTPSIIQLQYAIDEVYARYGATFPHRPDDQREFEKFSWHHPNPNLRYEAIDQLMSDVERQNIKFLALCRELKRGK
jgi:YARHG domain